MPMDSASGPEADALARCRHELDQLDAELIRLVARRLELGLRAAIIKKAVDVPILDPAREEKVIAQARSWARDCELPEDEVAEIFRRLVSLSGNAQLRAG